MEPLVKIIDQHGDAVWKTAWRILNHHEDALDCYQQTFLEASQLEPGGIDCWRAMLIRIVTARSLDRLRKRYRTRSRSEPLQHEPAVDCPPDDQAQNQEIVDAVRATLSTMPKNQASAFWLKHFEDLSANEIAQQLGIEPNHVRVLVHRAMSTIREKIAPT